MSREGRKGVESNRKLLNLDREGQGRLMHLVHRRFENSVIPGETACTWKVSPILWDNSVTISAFLGGTGGCPSWLLGLKFSDIDPLLLWLLTVLYTLLPISSLLPCLKRNGLCWCLIAGGAHAGAEVRILLQLLQSLQLHPQWVAAVHFWFVNFEEGRAGERVRRTETCLFIDYIERSSLWAFCVFEFAEWRALGVPAFKTTKNPNTFWCFLKYSKE